ncbi:hypothetical protein IW261DRAFT_1434793 [Armillaria novae-zelandiae]|uniref:RRM domain-containing protein n=1 Tax=Armillaria novae-zelandiae TaxID=153914 RepID=A0AA39PUR8_9AGAR|nr:hypothetical protein IW261DRAFT_1434793 [Armillaria novae-zelandiae]
MVRIHWSLLSKEGAKKAANLLIDGYMYTPGAAAQEANPAEKPKPRPLTKAERVQIEKKRQVDMIYRGLKVHPVIFVGNLNPDLTDDDLHKFFSDNCGPIRRVEIRCSQGCPAPTLTSLAPEHTPNIYYATVEFHSHIAVHKALTLSTKCKGVKLQISVSRKLLPEVDACIANILKKKDAKQASNAHPRRPITYQQQGTLILSDPSPDVNMLAGVGLPKTIL